MGEARTLHLNCDLGERGRAHPGDLRLLALVDAVNIACGGHAGDATTARDLARRAREAGVAVHLHPSYPDRDGFGRRSMDLPWESLQEALQRQRAALPEVQACKFHGALYNDAATSAELAVRLARWLRSAGVATVLAPPGSALADAARTAGIAVLDEGFADRRYVLAAGRPALMPRTRAEAVLHDPEAALRQVRRSVEEGLLEVEADGGTRLVAFRCATWCIHSDAPAAEAIASRLRAWVRGC